MEHGREVFGQTGTAERKSWLHVCAREVETSVPAHQVHDRARVHSEGTAQAPDLVGKGDLEGVKHIAAILESLRGARRRHDKLTRQMPEDLPQRPCRALRVRAGYGERRMVIVRDGRTLTQK